jgi:signal transduction histidine kinase
MRDLPRPEREWMVANGSNRTYRSGDIVVAAREMAEEMVIVLSGRIVVYVGHGAGRRHAMESRPGSMTGVLPYSRLKAPQWDVVAEETTELLTIHRDRFPEMIRECPVLVESLVHNMVDRVRRFAAADWQDQKVMSLGRLAAGLANELNNPAAAAASGAKRLTRAVVELGEAAHAVGMETMSVEQRAGMMDIMVRCQQSDREVPADPIVRSDLEDEFGRWLEANGVNPELAPSLVDGGVSMATLDSLLATVPGGTLPLAIRWIAATASTARIAGDVERATLRINSLVSAVRDHAYMDRAPVRELTDIGRGLSDTIEVVRPEANRKGVTIRLDVADALPRILAVGPDLNQVWSNLLQNALDAVSSGGEIAVHASLDNGSVVVRVVDNGTGIPPEVQPRIFDPFFTTRPAGSGVGLGLDIVRRTVRSHDGDVEVESRPGRTEFHVRLPLAAKG